MRRTTAPQTTLLTLLFTVLLCTCVRAQEAAVSGKVTDVEGQPLIGATVRVIGSVIGTSTDLDGHYELEVPPGRIRLLYSYIGYENYDTTLRVGVAEREFGVDVEMTESFLETGEVIVVGRRAFGQAQALRIQQSSQVTQTIIHSETFNKYPDVTIAETVSRMPGVSILRNINEGEIVQMRGLPEQYTAVALNGQRLPTIQPEVDQSGSLVLIQSNLVDEVRVVKARSADMDGDAIAGMVDFRVRHPESKFEIMAQAGAGSNFGFDGNPDQASGITQLAGVVNSELSDEKVYVLGAGSYLRHGRGTRTEMFEYGDTDARGRNLYSARPHDTNYDTERIGLVGAVELRPSIYNRMRLSYNLSEIKVNAQERLLKVDLDGDRAQRQTTGWQTDRKLNLVALEVENNFPKTRLDYQLSFSESNEKLIDRLTNAYNGTTGADIVTPDDLRGLDRTADVGAGPLTAGLRTQQNARLEETVAIGSVNLTRYLNNKRNSFVKIGGRFRSKDRAYGNRSVAAFPAAADDLEPGASPALLTERIVTTDDSLATRDLIYDAKQRIWAGYLMYAANFSAKLSLTAGARYEYREVEARDETAVNVADEVNVLPSVNLTYRVRRDRQFRLSYFSAVGYPSYGTYRPVAAPMPLIAFRQNSLNNPDIETTTSQNVDLTFERYGRRDGLFSVGLYYKYLDAPTLLVTESENNASVQFSYLNQITSANDASVAGVEVGMYQSLGFLNEKLRYLNVNGTYNYNYITVDNAGRIDDELPLAQAPRQSANLSLVYSNPTTRLNLVLAGNYRSSVFDRLLDGEAVYRNAFFAIDLSADYELIKNFSVYARLNNLTDHGYEEYIGESGDDDSLLRSRAQFGRWGVLGVRYRPE